MIRGRRIDSCHLICGEKLDSQVCSKLLVLLSSINKWGQMKLLMLVRQKV